MKYEEYNRRWKAMKGEDEKRKDLVYCRTNKEAGEVEMCFTKDAKFYMISISPEHAIYVAENMLKSAREAGVK